MGQVTTNDRSRSCADLINVVNGGTPPATGFVFQRTDYTPPNPNDPPEHRWIDANNKHVWISKSCADQLGGPSHYGTWNQMMTFATAGGGGVNPCQ